MEVIQIFDPMHNPQILREEVKQNIKEDFLEEDITILECMFAAFCLFIRPSVLCPIYEYMGVLIFFLSLFESVFLQQLVSEKDLIVREEACRIGLLFGGFSGSYHALRCLLRKLRRKETPLNA